MSYDLKVSQGDFQIGSDGDIAIVENNEKLIQDVLKIVLTPVGSNKLNPAYGSLVSKSLVGNIFPMDFLSSIASSQIKKALENLQNLQRNQSLFQPISAGEMLAAIQSVTLERNQVDPRFISVVIKLLSGDFNQISTEFSINPL